jgi:hypothetical protein
MGSYKLDLEINDPVCCELRQIYAIDPAYRLYSFDIVIIQLKDNQVQVLIGDDFKIPDKSILMILALNLINKQILSIRSIH